jgi:hypothetical protein
MEHSCLLNCTNAQSSQTECSVATSTSPSSAIGKGRKTVLRRIENGSTEPYSLSLAIVESPSSILKRLAPMLDNPEKTARLLAALKAAVPFEVELTPEVVKQLQAEKFAHADQTHRTVSDLSYIGDEGGILCHIVPPDEQRALFISLTHIRMPRTMPLAAAVIDYQKHRVKKLKKQIHLR